MKSGTLDIQGSILAGGLYQLISETLISAADSYTKALIHGNAIADATGKTVTAVGTAAVTTAQYKFTSVGASILLDGNSDYLTSADSSDWDFGTSDFSIDTWIRFNNTSVIHPIISQYEDATHYWYFEYYNSGTGGSLIFGQVNGGSAPYSWTGNNTWNPNLNQWYHIALTVNSGTLRIFIDGVSQTLTHTETPISMTLASTLRVGYNQDGGGYFDGWLAEVRVSKGIARWTSNFTVPTTPYDGATTSLIFSGLDGDTDVEWLLVMRFVSGAATTYFGLRLNNDSGTNYGEQALEGNNVTVYASRVTNRNMIYLHQGTSVASGNIVHAKSIICTKSGYLRTILTQSGNNISTTTISTSEVIGNVWNNTADNITSLVILANQTNGLGIGTHIFLFAKKG